MSDVMKKICDLAKGYEPELIGLRRYFHEHPELSWEEFRTTDRIEEELRKIAGVRVLRRGFGGGASGLTAEITGGKAGAGKCVALRSDIDALPVMEENNVEYRSKTEGVMHACGHDGHMAGLITAARILSQLREEFSGTVRLIFEPAEESGIRGGAKVLVEEGALEGVDAVFGLHLFTTHPAGKVFYRSGPCMTSADGWDLTITGKGGHGSAPELAVDPTIAAFMFGNAVQTLISRETSPRETAVISITSIESSSKTRNIIPESVKLMGATRTLGGELQDRLEAAMRRIIDGIAQTTRCRMDLDYMRFYPAVINDPVLTDVLKDAAIGLFGPEDVEEAALNMVSEDFSFYGSVVPATFAQVGVGDPKRPETCHPHHSSTFDLDESQLWRGAALHAGFAMTFLNRN
ncbi:MAG: amidohydrolase [Fretibacterium sp.]|nr:amidohydrolase [Fretibacterium sp.]